MRLLLLAAMAPAIAATTTYAHLNDALPLSVCRIKTDTLPFDFLQKLHQHMENPLKVVR
jgi:hypothetical protein